MAENTEKILSSCTTDQTDFVVKSVDGTDLDIVNISLTNGTFTGASTSEKNYTPEEVVYYKEVLYVPGIGNLVPGTRVIIKEKDYLLRFGWHTNVSNQNIYSWYLESLSEDIPPRTLYKEMIDEIEIVHYI